MKKTLLIIQLVLAALIVDAQLLTGDIAFTGFCADGDDNLAFVALNDIPAGTTIYLCDSEWNGSAFGDDENDLIWESGVAIIPEGTVVSIDNLGNSPVCNYGSITFGETGLSQSGDAMFAYLGTGLRQPTTFLAAISNIGIGFGTLSGTGLQAGFTAITLTETADIAVYNGPRSGVDKNGYFAQFNNMANWLIQDTGADDQNDGTAPDLPFNTTPFTFSVTDVTAPYVTSFEIISQTTCNVYFSEIVSNATVTNPANYTFSPSITISTIVFNTVERKATLTHNGLSLGVSTTLSVSNVQDLAGLTMVPWISSPIIYNPSLPNLVITEINYNIPLSNNNDLEFIEIYNAGGSVASLGGIQVLDEGNFAFTFPAMDLAAGQFVLLASNKTVADVFYSKTFFDMAPGSGNFLGNGGELLQIKNTEGTLIFSVNYDDASPWPLTPDGGGTSLELMNPAFDPNNGASWAASSTFLKIAEGKSIYASPGAISIVQAPSVSFKKLYGIKQENGGSISVDLEISIAGVLPASIDVEIVNDLTTAVSGADHDYTPSTYTFPANSTALITFVIPVIDNGSADNDKLLVLKLTNPVNCNIGSKPDYSLLILDNESSAPVGTKVLDIEFATSYQVDPDGSAEIVAFNRVAKRLYVMNSTESMVEILDFSNPRNIVPVGSISLISYGTGGTSVACNDNVVAASVSGNNNGKGSVVFMDLDGNVLKVLTVGYGPDMITFTPDNKYLLVANEGEPTDNYTFDPEGSISMIDLTPGINNLTQANVKDIDFNAYDSKKNALKAKGVRIFGLNATVSQDFEPEYITVSAISNKAWVTLQENNAIATIDLITKKVTGILPLKTKDHSLAANSVDFSDKNDSVFMSPWNVKGMYLPDAIASYVQNGKTYLITANEGDQREWGVIDEDVKVKDLNLDPVAFPNASIIKRDHLLGRLAVTPYDGDIDLDGDIDEIHAFGARSFSIWSTVNNALLFDSGSDFEKITAADPDYNVLFNASNDNNNFKNRSDNKGPEPEGVTVGMIHNNYYAFISMERIGGFMAYDVTNPASPEFVDYRNNRLLGQDEGGDLGPEGIIYINWMDSPVDTGLVVLANEISGTVSVYYIKNDIPMEAVPLKNWAIALMLGLIVIVSILRFRKLS
jgi:hypothetical protein